jgi:hypothetical protein
MVTLYKVVCDPGCSQVAYGRTGSAVNYAQPYIEANSAANCTSGDYFGVAFGTVIAPPGYTPPTGNVSGAGKTLSITC